MKLKLWDWVMVGQIIGNIIGIFWGRLWSDILGGLLVAAIIWAIGRGVIYWYGKREPMIIASNEEKLSLTN